MIAVVTCPFGCYGYVLVSGGDMDKLLALRYKRKFN
jgi:hypothetical protein